MIKRIAAVLSIILLISCEKEVKNYVSLEGKLNTPGIDKITIQGKNFMREIAVKSG